MIVSVLYKIEIQYWMGRYVSQRSVLDGTLFKSEISARRVVMSVKDQYKMGRHENKMPMQGGTLCKSAVSTG